MLSASKLFINGKYIEAISRNVMTIINPATEVVLREVACGEAEDIDLAVRAAQDAIKSWGTTTGSHRGAIMRRIAHGLKLQRVSLAELETKNCGKPIEESMMDVDDVASCFEYYADLAEKLDREQNKVVSVPNADYRCELRMEPIGVVGAIIPWNYPLLMSAWKICPSLAAGCTIVLKPSELTPLTALSLAQICSDAGLPHGVLNVVTGYGPTAGNALSIHPGIDKIAFTGSLSTGQKVMRNAADGVKNCTLELGGKSAIIVFEDADIERAVEWTMFGCFWTNGQICSATSRLLVQESIAEQFLNRLAERTNKISIGDPLDAKSKLGPVVSQGQYDRVISYVKTGIKEGATLLCGGPERPAELQKGYYIKPTIFTNVERHMRIWNEEIFGPVLCSRIFKTEEDAIREANDSEYGLAAAVFSTDQRRLTRVSNAMRVGVMWENCSQPTFVQMPWGGCKRSGIGRELGEFGLNNFLEPKQVTKYVADKPLGWYP